jgi:hypothetical protein
MDVIVLLVGIVTSIYLYSVYPVASYIILCVVGHFFLFCNVVRMSRIPELVWSVTFIGLVSSYLLVGWLSGLTLAIIIVIITCVLVALESKKPSYHGIGWQYINPKLPVWFQQRHEK